MDGRIRVELVFGMVNNCDFLAICLYLNGAKYGEIGMMLTSRN